MSIDCQYAFALKGADSMWPHPLIASCRLSPTSIYSSLRRPACRLVRLLIKPEQFEIIPSFCFHIISLWQAGLLVTWML